MSPGRRHTREGAPGWHIGKRRVHGVGRSRSQTVSTTSTVHARAWRAREACHANVQRQWCPGSRAHRTSARGRLAPHAAQFVAPVGWRPGATYACENGAPMPTLEPAWPNFGRGISQTARRHARGGRAWVPHGVGGMQITLTASRIGREGVHGQWACGAAEFTREETTDLPNDPGEN